MRRYYLSIRKDFILQKQNILLLIPTLSAAAIFINQQVAGVVGELICFFLIELFGFQILLNGLLQQEDNEFGRNALVASPYCRKLFVAGRYMFLALVFVGIYILHTFMSYLTNLIGKYRFDRVNIFIFALTLLFISVWESLNLTLYYQLGFSKMKIIGNVFIFSMPFVLPKIVQLFEENIKAAFKSDSNKLSLLMLISALVIYFVSYRLSLKLFSKRDL